MVCVAAVAVLAATAAMKLASVVLDWPEPQTRDPLLLVPGNWVLLLTVGIECLAVTAILWLRDGFNRGIIIASLGWQFLLYHWAYPQFGSGCPCLGSVWRWTQSSPRSAEWVSIGLAAWLAGTGTALVIREWRMRTRLGNRA